MAQQTLAMGEDAFVTVLSKVILVKRWITDCDESCSNLMKTPSTQRFYWQIPAMDKGELLLNPIQQAAAYSICQSKENWFILVY